MIPAVLNSENPNRTIQLLVIVLVFLMLLVLVPPVPVLPLLFVLQAIVIDVGLMPLIQPVPISLSSRWSQL